MLYNSKKTIYQNIPMWLTWGRVLIIPVFILVFYWEFPYNLAIATSMFGVAGFTDWLDGFLARKWQAQSSLGEFLDPIADKLLITVALIIVVATYREIWLTICIIILLCREMYVNALRQLMDSFSKHNNIKVSMTAKIKTTLQLIAITMLLYQDNSVWNIPLIDVGKLLIIIATVLSVLSMIQYTIFAIKQSK